MKTKREGKMDSGLRGFPFCEVLDLSTTFAFKSLRTYNRTPPSSVSRSCLSTVYPFTPTMWSSTTSPSRDSVTPNIWQEESPAKDCLNSSMRFLSQVTFMKSALIPCTFPPITPGGLHSQGLKTGAADVYRRAEMGEDVITIGIRSHAVARYNSSTGPRSATDVMT